MIKGRGLLVYVLLVCVMMALTVNVSTPVYAQVAGATLAGTVTDASSSAVPNAKVSIKNRATGVARDITTDSDGFYSAPNLLPGIYDITVVASGFSTSVQAGFKLNVGASQALNISLQIGQVTERVAVTATAPDVQLASSTLSAEVDSTTERELPLNGRDWTQLATLQPGVTGVRVEAGSSNRGNRGYGTLLSISGHQPFENNYRINGISINDYSNGSPGSSLGVNLGVDAIQEFSVLTGNYSAEYGRASGGVINGITKSGNNQFHGDAYYFVRDKILDARNYFDPAAIPPFHRDQFGVSGGVPIIKNKTFIFGDFEAIRQRKSDTFSNPVPSRAARGIAPGGTTPSQVAVVNGAPLPVESPCLPNTCVSDPVTHIDQAVLPYLGFYPLSNAGLPEIGDTVVTTFSAQQVINENFFTIRGDDKISDKDSLAGTYLRDFTPWSSPDGLDAVLVSSKTNRQIATLEETHTFGATLVNSARFGFSREWELNDKGVAAINPLAKDPTLFAIPNQFAAHVAVPAVLQLFNGGVNGNSNFIYAWNSFQGYDDAFWTHGTHSLKFGGGVERMQLNRLSHTDPSGVFTFSTLFDFYTNNPGRFTGEDASSVRPQGLRQTIFGLYIQDDWRFRPNLTVNLGLRWEMSTVINDNHGGIVNLINMTDPLPHCGRPDPNCAPGGPLFANSTLRNFEPRVGFAWDPFHNGKTAVRGSFGAFDILPMAYQFIATATKLFPFVASGSVRPAQGLAPGDFYQGAFPKLGPANKGGGNIEQYAHRSYDMQWNLNVQRELVRNLTAMVGYVGSRGVHEPFKVDDADIVIPTLTPEGRWLFPTPVQDPLNANFGSIGRVSYEGNSFYHALEVAVQKPK